jgi:hypothetical protein
MANTDAVSDNPVIGTCADCGLPLVPGADDGESDETAYPRSVGADGKLRYFCPASDDGLHHLSEGGRADGWCRTCGSPVGPGDQCGCWCMVADALQRYLGMDFDASAQMAADLWRQEADKAYVWTARYADDHDVTTYPPPAALAALQEQDRWAYPHDDPCPRCGRRQWTDEHAQETCQYCGYELNGA